MPQAPGNRIRKYQSTVFASMSGGAVQFALTPVDSEGLPLAPGVVVTVNSTTFTPLTTLYDAQALAANQIANLKELTDFRISQVTGNLGVEQIGAGSASTSTCIILPATAPAMYVSDIGVGDTPATVTALDLSTVVSRQKPAASTRLSAAGQVYDGPCRLVGITVENPSAGFNFILRNNTANSGTILFETTTVAGNAFKIPFNAIPASIGLYHHVVAGTGRVIYEYEVI